MKLLYSLLLLALCTTMFACKKVEDAQTIVDKAIEVHGGNQYQNLELAYDFRDKHYTLSRKEGLFTYTRSFSDSSGQVMDILTNSGFTRLINGDTVQLSQERQQAFSNSVNSVHYFALLPYGLNDPAVVKTYLAKTTIKGLPYHLIRVSFAPEGGGVDFEDVFLYWINADSHTMDYLAYSYKTEGGGLRFREATNARTDGGIRFQDYINYKPTTKNATLDSLQTLFERGELEQLSAIELNNIKVNPN